MTIQTIGKNPFQDQQPLQHHKAIENNAFQDQPSQSIATNTFQDHSSQDHSQQQNTIGNHALQDHFSIKDVRYIFSLKQAFPTSFDTVGNMSNLSHKTTFLREQVSNWDWTPSTDASFHHLKQWIYNTLLKTTLAYYDHKNL